MLSRTRSLCLTAMLAVLLALGAFATVPTVPPFTMQTFVLYCTLWLFGGKRAFAAVLLYFLLGAIGLPVFAGFQGGITVLFSPTGGYLLGFLLMALLSFVQGKTVLRRVLCLVVGTVGCYAVGTVWYAALYTQLTAAGLWAAALSCVVPFILPDLLKLILAIAVCKRLEPRLSRFAL